ncbi:hypothetical protein SEA_BURRO_9 [Microbacterium phage Burro]|uniref:RuvC-like resolvase n=1 Tax=Microbacterium phage Burro TaxID=2315703 RepID=A0A386KL51_9CAUD|nr:hypothetical protein HWB89_gp09 [Microbacterium phage Burro]AYD86152.1 hypothetical protein SEA_BURRO_9 [Microbacterium phage Burro]
MTMIHLNGIDPGLVHTGIVSLQVDSQKRTHRVWHQVVDGPDVEAVRDSPILVGTRIFIEKYEDRGTVFETHAEMRKFETNISNALPGAKVMSNVGVKKVVTDKMLAILIGDLPATHHKDLESAARIMIAGGLKDPVVNSVLYHLMIDHLAGASWRTE